MRSFLQNRPNGRRAFTMIEIMIVVGITGIIVAIAAPTWWRQRSLSQQRACQENLSKLDGAKEQWALENQKHSPDVPDMTELYQTDGSGYLKTEVACPAQGEYTINPVGTKAECSISDPFNHNESR